MAFPSSRDEENDENVRRIVRKALAARHPPGMRPLPVFVNGKEISLHSLLKIAKSLGGYERISREQGWGQAAMELGFASHTGPSIKLVYVKYLKALESGNIFKDDDQEKKQEHQEVQQEGQTEEQKPASTPKPAPKTTPKPATSRRKSGRTAARGTVAAGDSREKTEKADEDEAADFSKQARETVAWLRRLAVKPTDPLRGQGGLPDQNSVDRCSELVKTFRRVSCQTRTRRSQRRQSTSTSAAPQEESDDDEREVRVGADHQAVVPPFEGNPMDHDQTDRFLGTMVWGQAQNAAAQAAGRFQRIGKGSCLHKKCSCVDKGCIRLHIREEKQQLKLELGEDTYRRWGFDKMGENVAASWSDEEQKKFKAAFRGGGDPWWNLKAALPNRSRADLVSYYFNVFKLRRRAIQNRTSVRPNSDADGKA